MIDIFNIVLYGEITLWDVLVVVLVLILSLIIAKIVTLNLKKILSDKVKKDVLEIILRIVNYGIIIAAVLAVLPQLNIDLSGLLVAGGIAGLVIGFASQSVVANLVSGLFLMIERPIRIGDQISIEGVSGFVEDIHIFSTIIRTYDGVYIRIPNEKVFTSNITNYVANVARRFEYLIGIRYVDDANKAIEIIKKVIDAHPFALKNPSPTVFVDELGDNSVNIRVRIWAPSVVWYDVKMELLWKMKVELERNGIEIPFPQRVIWFGDKGGVKIESGEDISA
ncbi:mechanosensitive ion channel family protein [Archaeoglobales archaeon]|nr:MAG: mechanosensitive ion channel family protein [Archaeoglobales archaeon]